MKRAKPKKREALVLLSGGLDSSTCLFWAMEKFDGVTALSFDYDQIHGVELACAERIVLAASEFWKNKKCEHIVEDISMPVGKAIPSALLSRTVKLKARGGYKNLPTSYVPGRNLIFLSYACTKAMVLGIHDVVIGVNVQDYSGYPDCRPEFIELFIETFKNATLYNRLDVHTPLMYNTKAQIFKMFAHQPLLFVPLIHDTLSCYVGCETRNDWGMGCGKCPACRIRKKGFKEYCERAYNECKTVRTRR